MLQDLGRDRHPTPRLIVAAVSALGYAVRCHHDREVERSLLRSGIRDGRSRPRQI
jgi:hypothetical protein